VTLNPEFRRNLWLQLSAQRLIAAPAVLAIIFGLVFTVSADNGPVAMLSRWGFLLFALLWGTRRAADSVAEEVNAGTWDGQRMSSLGAWSMAWGKLIGGPVYTWYCGLLCLAVHATARAASVDPIELAADLLLLVEAALLGQAVAMGVSLALWRKRLGRRPLRWAAGQLAGLVAGIAVAVRADNPLDLALLPQWYWYGLSIDVTLFRLVSLAVFFGWALLGVYRLMLQELQYRTRPWAWVGFVLFCLAYVGGFTHEGTDLLPPVPGAWRWSTTALAIVLVYVALFIEPKSLIRYRQFLGGRVLDAMPLWLPTWLIAAVVLAAALVAPGGDTASGRMLSPPVAAAQLLFMLRDIVFVLALNVGRSPGRADLPAFLYLAIAYLPLGWLLMQLNEPLAVAFVLPTPSADSLLTIAPVAAELVLVAGFLWYRWSRHGVPWVAGARPAAVAAGA
jgi:hypothetical protein